MSRQVLNADLGLDVGTMSRPQLFHALNREDVGLNASAETLLDNPVFGQPRPQSIAVEERTVGELGFPTGAPLPQILQAAQQQGLHLCPPRQVPTFGSRGCLSRTRPIPSCRTVERPQPQSRSPRLR